MVLFFVCFLCFQESWHLHCFVAALAVIFWVCMSGSSPWSPPGCQACPVNSPDSSLVFRWAFLGFLPIWGRLCTAFKSQHHLRWLVFPGSKRLSLFYVWLLSLSLSLSVSFSFSLFSAFQHLFSGICITHSSYLCGKSDFSCFFHLSHSVYVYVLVTFN